MCNCATVLVGAVHDEASAHPDEALVAIWMRPELIAVTAAEARI